MKYLRLIPIMLLGAMLASCNTTKKLYEAQEYDQVIMREAPSICHGNKNADRINMVAASYHKANQADHERIQALKATGQPDVWPEIYQRYCSMKGRSEALSCFPREVKKEMGYMKLDLNEELVTSRAKAESFLVAKTNQLFDSGTEEDVLEAAKYKAQLMRTNPENPSLGDLQKKWMLHYPMPVLLSFSNDIRLNLPDGFSVVVMDFDEGELPAYNEFHTQSQRKTDYFTNVWVLVKDVEATPSRIDKVSFKETNGGKEVEVTDYSQNKTVKVTGTINFCEYYKGKIDYSIPFEVTSTFTNEYSTIKGDRGACSEETLQRLGGNSVPVPTDESMLLDAAKKLNDLIAAELKK
jgi:hypothetical protein